MRVSSGGGSTSRKGRYLRLSCVLIGLDEDFANADIFAHGPKRGLHGLSRPENRHTRNLLKAKKRANL